MALGTTDERDLLLPLFSGMHEDPLWDTFLHRLLARTQAQRLHLFVRPSAMSGMPLLQRTIRAHGYLRPAGFFDLETFGKAGLLPYASLRPYRVYSLEDAAITNNSEVARRQQAILAAASVAHARFIRIMAPGNHDAWLILLHDRLDFSAGDSALLSALAPHVELALTLLMQLHGLHLRAAIAENALALLGVGQAIFDASGQAIIADAVATEELDIQSTGRAQLRTAAARAISAACQELSTATPEARCTVRYNSGKHMLLRRAPDLANGNTRLGLSVGLVRQDRRENAKSAAPVVAATFGLSNREAALAELISQGKSILEAGAELLLTPETARNYSKRIYTKTGATGQADLVRKLLTGLTPFA